MMEPRFLGAAAFFFGERLRAIVFDLEEEKGVSGMVCVNCTSNKLTSRF
jgi:hypothetical protein